MTVHARFLIAASALLALTAAAYWPGLNGEFILDDRHNLAPVLDYAQGNAEWDEAVFSASGRFGRPLAMATFLLNIVGTSDQASLLWVFKLSNLIIHLCIGVLVFFLMCALLRKDQTLAENRHWLALGIAGLWLLAPLQVSTVLYTIQRMAQLSALFVLAGLLAYIAGRNHAAQGRHARAAIWLLGVFPVLLVLGILNKENALLLPLLAAVIEVAYFVRNHRGGWPTAAFFLLFMFLPGLAAVGYLVTHPDTITGGYTIRDFTLGERLLSQPRALFGYLSSLFVPNAHGLGLFHDDFQASNSLLSPLSTLASLLGWMCLGSLSIWAWIKRRPTLCFGIAFFLGAHALESGIFPLELYFEHRNYLPSLGAIAALIAGAHWALEHSSALRKMAPAAVVTYLCLFGAATWARAGVWASNETMVEQAFKGHPNSPRVRVHIATQSARQGQVDEALAHLDVARRHDPVNAPTYALNVVSTYCLAEQGIPDSAYQAVADAAPTRVTAATTGNYRSLVEQLESGYCPQLELERLKQAVDQWISTIDANTPQNSVSMQYSWLLRMFHSRVAARLMLYTEAVHHASSAFDFVPDRVDVGLFLIQMHLAAGSFGEARKTIETIEGSYNGGNPKYDRALAELKAIVDKELNSS